MHCSDQRQRDAATVVDPEFACQVVLAECYYANLVTGPQTVLGMIDGRQRGKIAARPAATSKQQQRYEHQAVEVDRHTRIIRRQALAED